MAIAARTTSIAAVRLQPPTPVIPPDPDRRPAHAVSVVHQALADELVLLDLETERYYSLDAVGARAWALMDGRHRVCEIAAALHAEFDAPPERIAADLHTLLAELHAAGLIEWAAD